MSISDKFRAWSEMDTQDDFIQYLERIVSGDPALAAASTAGSRTPGINRPLSRLAHNTDAIADAVMGANSRLLTCADKDGTIEFTGTSLVFTKAWTLHGIHPIADGTHAVVADATTHSASGAGTIIAVKIDRESDGAAPTFTNYATISAYRTAIRADADKLDYFIFGVTFDHGGTDEGVYLFNGWTVRENEKLRWDGTSTYLAVASVQRSNSGTSAQIFGGGVVQWASASHTLTWSLPLVFSIPGVQDHEITAGSFTFTNTRRSVYFTPDRAAAATVTVNPATDLVKELTGNVDIDGHNGVDLILVGKVNSTYSCFTFASGRTLVDGIEVDMEGSSVETLSFTDQAGTTRNAVGNVTLKVAPAATTDGLNLSTVSTSAGNSVATLSMTPLWHDRFLTSLMYSQSNDEIATRVIYDSTNGNGELFTFTSAGDGDLNFRVPGYDSTLFTLKLDGTGGFPGLTLSDNEVAWVVLPSRSYTGATYHFWVGGSGASSGNVSTGGIADFPQDDPDAYIVAHKYPTATFPGYTFLGVKGIRDGTRIPLFEADRVKTLVASHASTAAGYCTGKDFDIEFGHDAAGTNTSSTNMYYIRFTGADTRIEVRRPGYTMSVLLQQGTGVDKGTGSTGSVIWEIANAGSGSRDTAWVYVDPDLPTLKSGDVTVNALLTYEDQDLKPGDDTKILFGCFHYGTAASPNNARFTLWDGTQLDLDGQATITVSGTPSGLLEDIHEGLEAAMDGGSHEPSSTNKFITHSESTGVTDALDSRVDVIEADYVTEAELDAAALKTTTGVMATALSAYVPFLQGSSLEAGHMEDMYMILNGWNHIQTSHHGEIIYINGGAGIFGDTYLFDVDGSYIDISDKDQWIGVYGNTSLSNVTHKANHSIDLIESIWYGDRGGFTLASGSGFTQATNFSSTTQGGGHRWQVKGGNAAAADPKCFVWGRNYIYVRPNPSSTYTKNLGTSKICNRASVKVSKYPPFYSNTGSGYGQGTRTFDDTLDSNGFGDDEGTWLCIGTCYLYFQATDAELLAAVTGDATLVGDDGSGATGQTAGFSVVTNYLSGEQDRIKCVPFTKVGNQVRFLAPLPIHYNIKPRDGTTTGSGSGNEFDGGVDCKHPAYASSTTTGTPLHSGAYNVAKGHYPNTGISMADNAYTYNGVSTSDGANLNLEPLMPEVPIGDVNFRISWGIDKVTTSDLGTPIAFKIRGAQDCRVSSSANANSDTWPTLANDHAFLKVFYLDNGQHVHEDSLDKPVSASSADYDMTPHVNLEFTVPMVSSMDGLLIRTEINNVAGLGVFESVSSVDFTGDFDPFEHYGVWITGYTENFMSCMRTAPEPFNIDIDEGDPDSGIPTLSRWHTYDDS